MGRSRANTLNSEDSGEKGGSLHQILLKDAGKLSLMIQAPVKEILRQ